MSRFCENCGKPRLERCEECNELVTEWVEAEHRNGRICRPCETVIFLRAELEKAKETERKLSKLKWFARTYCQQHMLAVETQYDASNKWTGPECALCKLDSLKVVFREAIELLNKARLSSSLIDSANLQDQAIKLLEKQDICLTEYLNF